MSGLWSYSQATAQKDRVYKHCPINLQIMFFTFGVVEQNISSSSSYILTYKYLYFVFHFLF